MKVVEISNHFIVISLTFRERLFIDMARMFVDFAVVPESVRNTIFEGGRSNHELAKLIFPEGEEKRKAREKAQAEKKILKRGFPKEHGALNIDLFFADVYNIKKLLDYVTQHSHFEYYFSRNGSFTEEELQEKLLLLQNLTDICRVLEKQSKNMS